MFFDPFGTVSSPCRAPQNLLFSLVITLPSPSLVHVCACVPRLFHICLLIRALTLPI
jgi:hypothetical protein